MTEPTNKLITPTGGDLWLPGPDGGMWFQSAAVGNPFVWISPQEAKALELEWKIQQLQADLRQLEDVDD